MKVAWLFIEKSTCQGSITIVLSLGKAKQGAGAIQNASSTPIKFQLAIVKAKYQKIQCEYSLSCLFYMSFILMQLLTIARNSLSKSSLFLMMPMTLLFCSILSSTSEILVNLLPQDPTQKESMMRIFSYTVGEQLQGVISWERRRSLMVLIRLEEAQPMRLLRWVDENDQRQSCIARNSIERCQKRRLDIRFFFNLFRNYAYFFEQLPSQSSCKVSLMNQKLSVQMLSLYLARNGFAFSMFTGAIYKILERSSQCSQRNRILSQNQMSSALLEIVILPYTPSEQLCCVSTPLNLESSILSLDLMSLLLILDQISQKWLVYLSFSGMRVLILVLSCAGLLILQLTVCWLWEQNSLLLVVWNL